MHIVFREEETFKIIEEISVSFIHSRCRKKIILSYKKRKKITGKNKSM